MKGKRRSSCGRLGALGLVLFLLLAGAAEARAGGSGYTLAWNTVYSGYNVNTAGYSLGSTAGQAGAGVLSGSGGYTVSAGFWSGGFRPLVLDHRTYLPAIFR